MAGVKPPHWYAAGSDGDEMDARGGKTGFSSTGGDLLLDLFVPDFSLDSADGGSDSPDDVSFPCLPLDAEADGLEKLCSKGFGSRSKSARFWRGEAERGCEAGDMLGQRAVTHWVGVGR